MPYTIQLDHSNDLLTRNSYIPPIITNCEELDWHPYSMLRFYAYFVTLL